ncbi:MAG: antirestriction protein ArdA [Clostridiales bacterium]|nr:antirestriction protein ArdA [Clostridiales bacterium]
MRKILNVYLARANTPYGEAYADLDLPASPYELLDALDKLRLDEGEAPYLQINEYYDFEGLAPLLSGDAGLYELNALTHQLAELDEQQQISFKGLIQMEVNKKQGLIPTSRLIDLAYSVDCCLVADALNDAQLGRFYAENGFVLEVEQLPDKVFELLDFEKIGREARIGEGGVFTEKGYVVQHTELNEAFFALDLTPHHPDYQILLESEDGSMLKLPQAKLPDTTLCRCLDCRIPQLMGSIEASGSIATVNEFAGRLSGMTDREMLRYKAVLAATKCGDLQSAVSLLDNLDHYMLDTKISSPESAALAELNFMVDSKDMERLQRYVNMPAYGRDLLEHDNAVITPYGHMARDDFRPILAPFEEPTLGGMEML